MRGDPDRFEAAADGPPVETKVKGSRFIAQLCAATSLEAAAAALRDVRREHHAATHHCWAARCGAPDATAERFDDDGEPSGSAGRPILAALQGAALHDALLVVTRYFGGTKLGTGGLARAYGEAAAGALAAAPRRSFVVAARLDVGCSFDEVGSVEALLARAADRILEVERRYEPAPHFTLRVPRAAAAALTTDLRDATGGRATVALTACAPVELA